MPRIPESIINEIQERTDIIELISSYIPLKKLGRSYKALCPFHNEKTPSFVVSQEKQIFHCFGCNEGGNVFSFLTKYENISFYEAVLMLADKINIEIPNQNNDPQQESNYKKSIAILASSANFYNKHLLSETNGAPAMKYLESRKFSKKVIEDFQLGFAPDAWDALLTAATKKQYTEEELLSAGMIIEKKNQGGYYDRFRNRLIFPINNATGKTIAFGARVLDDSLPKYINSPENAYFNKSKNLYGLDKAKKAILNEDSVLIVEGYFDMIRPYQEGIKNVVATLGTALTNDHAKILKRFTNNVIMLYDSDSAGVNAVNRNIELFLQQGLNAYIVTLEEAKDPDEFILKFGAEKFKNFIKNNKKDFFEFKLNSLSKEFDIEDEIGKSKIAENMIKAINLIENSILKNEYFKKLSKTLYIPEKIIEEFSKSSFIPKQNKPKKDILAKVKSTKLEEAERLILKKTLENQKNYGIIKGLLEKYELKFQSKTLNFILDVFNTNGYKDNKEIYSFVQEEEIKNEITSALFIETLDNKENGILNDCFKTLLLYKFNTDIDDLKKLGQKSSNNTEQWNDIIKKIAFLNKEKAKINQKGVIL